MTDEGDRPLSTTDQLRRIDGTGTVWFGAGLIAAALVVAGLLAGGRHPGDRMSSTALLWWAAAVINVVSLGCLAWAGCPVLGRDLQRSNQNKSIAVRVGVVGMLVCGAVVGALVLLGAT